MIQSKYQPTNDKKLKQYAIKELKGTRKNANTIYSGLVSKKYTSNWSTITLLGSFHYNIGVTTKLTCKYKNALTLENQSRITNLHVEDPLHEHNWVTHYMKMKRFTD